MINKFLSYKFSKVDIFVLLIIVLLIWGLLFTQLNSETQVEISSQKTIKDFQYAKIGGLAGTTFDEKTTKVLPNSTFKFFPSYSSLILSLTSKKVDAIAVDQPIADQFTLDIPGINYIKDKIFSEEYSVAFAKTDKGKKLRDEYNDFLRTIKADGTFEYLAKHWLSDQSNLPQHYIDTSDLTGENGTLKFATEGESVPFSYYYDGHLTGYEIDLAVRFCRMKGYKIDMTTVSYDAIIPGIKVGKFDLSDGINAPTKERAENFYFSDASLYTDIYLLYYEGTTAKQESLWKSLKNSIKKNFITEKRWMLIVKGLNATIFITFLSVFLGSIMALMICFVRRTESPLASFICEKYIKFIQNIPVLVFLMILCYVIFKDSSLSGEVVASIGFAIYFSTKASEIIYSGLKSVDKGQCEAGLVLGFSQRQIFGKIVFPQAASIFLPVYNLEIISLLQNTSIVGYLAVEDMTKMIDIIRSKTYDAFIPIMLNAMLYFILASCISLFFSFLESKLKHNKNKSPNHIDILM